MTKKIILSVLLILFSIITFNKEPQINEELYEYNKLSDQEIIKGALQDVGNYEFWNLFKVKNVKYDNNELIVNLDVVEFDNEAMQNYLNLYYNSEDKRNQKWEDYLLGSQTKQGLLERNAKNNLKQYTRKPIKLSKENILLNSN